ncbi:hypothetical protein NEIFLAOT_02014 [Neisseria flavescens NRL30031/H210]|uniref:Uncharacterized protein n=1 Tax=Neisseria flavescens NRL30031/H210 TaxID=546264 RepID=C0EPX3_NEIFL|nr:hypothetical protein NEIFLAOT_02014 [Neisseria flavescens NRL30031/H210]
MPRLVVLSVLSAASSPCPDLNLIHYKTEGGFLSDGHVKISPLLKRIE